MAWIKVYQALSNNHRKILHLMELLEIGEAETIGHLVCLWLWSLDNAPNGTLPAVDLVIARAAKWEKVAVYFVNALFTAHWIDRVKKQYVLHDWNDYIGELISKRAQNKERMRNARAANVQSTCSERAHPRALARVEKSRVEKSRVESTPLISPLGETPADFQAFWNLYPRKIGKARAVKCWNALLKLKATDRPSSDDLIAAATHYADYCQQHETAQEYIKHPSTFLSLKGRDFEDWITTSAEERPFTDYDASVGLSKPARA